MQKPKGGHGPIAPPKYTFQKKTPILILELEFTFQSKLQCNWPQAWLGMSFVVPSRCYCNGMESLAPGKIGRFCLLIGKKIFQGVSRRIWEI